jgi:hypothetical protein
VAIISLVALVCFRIIFEAALKYSTLTTFRSEIGNSWSTFKKNGSTAARNRTPGSMLYTRVGFPIPIGEVHLRPSELPVPSELARQRKTDTKAVASALDDLLSANGLFPSAINLVHHPIPLK